MNRASASGGAISAQLPAIENIASTHTNLFALIHVAEGVIDPTKVVRCALEDASSVNSLSVLACVR